MKDANKADKRKDPLDFLASINIKTKRTPVQMKRKAEKYFVVTKK